VFIYPNRDGQLVPEHEAQDEMREWFRSEPTSLPFSEVWQDLVQLLERQDTFVTLTAGNSFSVRISDDPRGLQITSAGEHRYITYDTLMSLWQQLRTHGFSMRQIAPGISRTMSYIIPIFAKLPYVKPVKIAEDYDSLSQSPITGLQVLPCAFNRSPAVMQLPLVRVG